MIGLSLAISKWWGFFTGSQLGTVELIRNTGLMKVELGSDGGPNLDFARVVIF